MIKKIALASVIAASLASTSVMANEATTGVVVGLYGGYGMPINGWLKDLSTTMNGTAVSVKNKSGSMAAGGLLGFDFALNPMFSVGAELNGQYFFKQKFEATSPRKKVEVNSKLYSGILFLTGKFYIPETGGLNLFAKAGYALHKFKGDVADMLAKKTIYRPVAAGGIGYNIENINIFIQGQYNWLPYDGQSGSYGAVFAGASYTLPI